MGPAPQIWLVASVSEAMLGQANMIGAGSHARQHPSKSWWFGRAPSPSFQIHQGGNSLLESAQGEQASNCASQASPCGPSQSCTDSITCDSFRVQGPGRGNPLHHLIIPPDIEALGAIDPADILSMGISTQAKVTNMLKQLLPKLHMLVTAQRQALHSAGKWARRHRHTHSEQVCTDSSSRREPVARMSTEEQRLSELARQAEKQANPALAAELYSQLAALHPTAETYARLSKQYTDMAYLPVNLPSREKAAELNSKAVQLAMQAVATDPNVALGHIALCVSRGRLALVSDNRTKVQLAKDAADDAATALRLEPNNDLAHHLMGRWHYEMAQINAVARYLIRLFFGASLMQGTFHESLNHYRIAAEICPSRAIHRVEIGRTLLKLGDTKAAVQELQRALEMDIEDINASLQVEDAAVMLQKLKQSDKLGLFLPAPQSSSGTEAHGSSGSSSSGSGSGSDVDKTV